MSSKTSIQYHHNLNCTWILTAGQGFYVNFEIDYFWVNNDKEYELYYIILDILFSSNHNIHKSSYDHCFWASDPLIESF